MMYSHNMNDIFRVNLTNYSYWGRGWFFAILYLRLAGRVGDLDIIFTGCGDEPSGILFITYT